MALRKFAKRSQFVDPGAALQQAAILACLRRGSRPQIQAILNLFDGGTIVHYAFQPASSPPSVVIWKKDRHFGMAVAGTANPLQYVGHFAGAVLSKTTLEYSSNDFFTKIARTEAILGALKPFMLAGEIDTLSFTGHSYGGGVVNVLALIMGLGPIEFPEGGTFTAGRIEVMTFGAPRSVGNDWPKRAYPAEWFHVYHGADPVPKMPPRFALIVTNPISGEWSYSKLFDNQWAHLAERVAINDNGDIVEFDPEGSETSEWLPSLDAVSLDRHPIDRYLRLLMRYWARHENTPPERLLIPQMEALLGTPDNQSDDVSINPSTYLDFHKANTLYYGEGSTVLTPETAVEVESVSLSLGGAELDGFTNIGGSGAGSGTSDGGVKVATSGFWQITMLFGNGKFGRSESHVWNGGAGSTIEEALDKGMTLCSKRRLIFGEDSAAPTVQVKNLGTPQIEFLRITDAINLRFGQVFDVSSHNYMGRDADVAKAADVFSTTLSMRMRGQCATDADSIHFSNLILCGQPDGCVHGGRYVPTFVTSTSPTTHLEEVKQYITHLTTVGNGLGFMGLPANKPTPGGQPIKSVAGFNLDVGGLWRATLTAHGYTSGDRVNITGASNSLFNGNWTIIVFDVNSFGLQGGPPLGATAPTLAKVQRYQAWNGERFAAFYKFLQPVGGVSLEALNIKVRKVELAREYIGMSFPRRGSRKA